MKILVPITFEAISFTAFVYASKLIEDFGGEIVLLNVVHLAYDSVNPLGGEYVDAVVKGVEARMDYFINQYPQDKKVDIDTSKVSYDIKFGVPSYSIANFAEDEKVDMIVMGTRDKHGIFDQLLGSTSANVISTATCPVMLVHSNTDYHPINNIAFAFDNKGELEHIMNDFVRLNKQIGAKTDFIHIAKQDEDISTLENQMKESLINSDVSFSFEFKKIISQNIKETIIDYCQISDTDMLAMVHRERGFLSSLLRPSMSARVAQEFKLPVLVFHDEGK